MNALSVTRSLDRAGLLGPPHAPVKRLIWAIFLFGFAALTAQRLWLLSAGGPLWLDETWTAMIVSQPSWSSFWREAYLDVNGPLYYLILHVWQSVAGHSDVALRLPSLLFVTLSGLAPIVWRPLGLSREAALLWAVLILSWWPGIAMSVEARAYGLLLLVSTLQAIAFIRLLHAPTLRSASVWCALASLAILAHYYSLFPVAAQAIIFLARHPKAALSSWPGSIFFAPTLAWLAVHASRLSDFAAPGVAWYDAVTWDRVWSFVAYALGAHNLLFLAAILLVLLAISRWPGSGRDEAAGPSSHLWLAAASGLVALAAILAIGMVRPMLIQRYLTPLVPLLLLSLVLAARQANRAHLAYAAVAAIFLASSLRPAAHAQNSRETSSFGLASASSYLLGARPDRIVFALDVGAMAVLDPQSVAKVGAFLLRRAGNRAEVKAVRLGGGTDPSRLLLQQADGSRPAILWFYNVDDRSAGRSNPPRIAALAPDWACQSEAEGPFRIVACAPRRQFSD